jgi:hypothetical protein
MIDLPDLSDLLAESLTSARETAAAKASRQRLAKGGLTAAEREADAQRIREWEAKHEWEAAANVALFHIFECGCGSSAKIFEGMYRRETHRHLKHGAARHVAVESAKADLPNEVAVRVTETAVCGKCMDEKGWDLTNATEWQV